MIGQMQAPEQFTRRRATKAGNKTGARLSPAIPDRVDHIPNPEYLRPGTEETLFGPQAPTVPVSQWRPAVEVEDGQKEVEPSQAKSNLSRQDEALLFRRYNCARYHLADLMEKQARRFAAGRALEIRAWQRRVLENRAALTQANMALVVAMAKRTRITSVEFGELVSEGNMALLRAVDKFDFSRGFKFSTYACCAILKAFSRLATKAGIYHQRFPASSDAGLERSDEVDRRHTDQRELAVEDLRRVLISNRAGLTDVEQTVLGARFAVVGHNRVHTLQEVGGLVRLSRERVRQVQNQVLTKMRLALQFTVSPAPSSDKAHYAFDDLATASPGRMELRVLTAAGCGT